MENDTTNVLPDTTTQDDNQVDNMGAPEVDATKLAELNKKLYERAKKAEAEAKELKAKYATAETPKLQETKDVSKSDERNFTREELNLRLDGYAEDEVDFIIRNGGRKELQNPSSLVSIAIKTKKEQRIAEENAAKIPDSSALSEVERKYTQEQLSKMSTKELEKILPFANN